jgi:fe2+ transport system protein A
LVSDVLIRKKKISIKEKTKMTLIELENGQKARIVGLEGNRRYLSRITSIGLNIGCTLEMLQNSAARPLLVYGRDTMIALNREESKKILVEAI